LKGEFINSHAQTTIAHLPAIRLQELLVGVPSDYDQARIAASLVDRFTRTEKVLELLEVQLAEIDNLPAALLRQAFSGGLRLEDGPAPLEVWLADFTQRQAAIGAYAVSQLHARPTFGRV